MLLGVLDNQPGPALDIVVLNAGAALYAANVTSTMAEGVVRSREAIRLGAAREKLSQLVQATQAYRVA
jgi:anthranilate phosphoribosyltransferase